MANKTILGIGIFITLALITGGIYYVETNKNYSPYYCETSDSVGLCWKLSNPNLNNLSTRCFWNQTSPTSYKQCSNGWKPLENFVEPDENIYNESENATLTEELQSMTITINGEVLDAGLLDRARLIKLGLNELGDIQIRCNKDICKFSVHKEKITSEIVERQDEIVKENITTYKYYNETIHNSVPVLNRDYQFNRGNLTDREVINTAKNMIVDDLKLITNAQRSRENRVNYNTIIELNNITIS